MTFLPAAAKPANPAPQHRKLTPGEEAQFAKLPFWLRADQVRKLLADCSEQTLRALRLAGQIECRDFRTPSAKRPTYRYYRDSVRVYLLNRPSPVDLLGY